MTLEEHSLPDPVKLPPKVPTFSGDLVRGLLTLSLSGLTWIILFTYMPFFLSLGILGLIIVIVAILWLLPYTFSGVNRLFEAVAYQRAASQTQLPYLNYPTKCQFLQRRQLNFTCMAEQLAPFDLTVFNRCHNQPLWELCWQERIPSILEVFDMETAERQQRLGFILAAMKEYAKPAATKMLEVLNNEDIDTQVRITAGYALEEMKEDSAITTLVGMIGRLDQQADKLVQSVVARYGETALPDLINALQLCDSDIICGSLVETIGRIKNDKGVPALDQILNDTTKGEFTRMQALYALRTIGSETAFKRLIAQLETAQTEEHSMIKTVCLANKEICFPILIELLADKTISETYYERIGDILAEEGAKSYGQFFTQLRKTKDDSTILHLVQILKEHTPENDEEFIGLHQVLDSLIDDLQAPNIPPQ
ncbi:MAG: HEAT repeat domain-containing protein [Candidatus Heimdallarchaeota archaeon]